MNINLIIYKFTNKTNQIFHCTRSAIYSLDIKI